MPRFSKRKSRKYRGGVWSWPWSKKEQQPSSPTALTSGPQQPSTALASGQQPQPGFMGSMKNALGIGGRRSKRKQTKRKTRR